MQENESAFKHPFTRFTNLKASLWLIIIGCVVFFNMLSNNFVEDDKKYIIDYPLVHQINLPVTFGVNVFNAAGQYRPIPATYFSILYSLFSTTPFFYHILQLMLHIIVTVLVYFVFRKFLSKDIAFFGALIFLVHPIQVESVSYIAQTVSPLFTLFGLIPFLLFSKENISKKEYIIGFFLLLLSLLTKETGIIFLLLILLYCLLFVRKNIWKLSVGMVLVLVVYAFFRLDIGHVGLSTRLLPPIASLPLVGRLTNIPAIVFYYLKTFFFPNLLAFDQQWVISEFNFTSFYLPLLLNSLFFLTLIVLGLYISKQSQKNLKPYSFFSAWFLFALFFHIQIFPLDATVGDRWFYLPMIGLVGMLGIVMQSLFSLRRFKAIFITFGIVIVLGLSLRTMVRNTNWQSAITLYTHDIAFSDNYDIENSLGTEYQDMNDTTNALIHFQRSQKMRTNEFNLHNLGVTYTSMGNMEKAKTYFYMALHAKDYKTFLPHKHDENSYKSYASILLYYDDKTNRSFIQNALVDYPDSSDLWMFLALARLQAGDKQNALVAIANAYKLIPSQQNTYIYEHIVNNQPFSINLYAKSINFE